MVTPIPMIQTKELAASYGTTTAFSGISLEIQKNELFGIIGPANSGKTSFLRALNGMNDFVENMTITGGVAIGGRELSNWKNRYALRRKIGVVFPLPVGLPLSIYDNVAFAPILRGVKKKADLDIIVEHSLRRAALWDEVKDRLNSLGSLLSGGQQQRLTIARALSQEPSILLLDEFSIAIDPVTTAKIEDALLELKEEMTIVMVTNLVQQARRLADRTAFFLAGECVEVGDTSAIFAGQVADKRTIDYVEGRFG